MTRCTLKVTALLLTLCISAGPVAAHGFSGPLFKWYDWCWIIPAMPFLWTYDKITRSISANRKETVYVRGVKCRVYRSSLSYHIPDKEHKGAKACFWRGILARTTAIPVGNGRVLFGPGELAAYPCGGVQMGVLAKETEFAAGKNRVLLAANTMAVFYKDGSLAEGSPKTDMVLLAGSDTIRFRAGREIPLLEGDVLEWGEDGRLTAVYPQEGSFRDVRGKGTVLSLGTVIRFYPGGNLKRGYPGAPITARVRGQSLVLYNPSYPHWDSVDFYEDGSLKRAPLDEDGSQKVLLGGRLVPMRRFISFYPDGRVKGGLIYSEALVLGKGPRRGIVQFFTGEISLHKNGALRSGRIQRDETVYINGTRERINWATGVDACFYENGEVMSLDVEHRRNPNGSFISYTYKNIPLELQTILSLGSQVLFKDFRRGVIDAFLCESSEHNCKSRLTQQDIVLDEADRHVWVRYSDVKTERIESLLFDTDAEIHVKGKKISCRSYQWMPIGKL